MINRLLGIIYFLMSKETVTAAELAERFEVSIRTIYRDIDNLSMAGIPVYARQGKHGGISLTEQFVLNKMLVTKEEQQQILTALTSLTETGAQTDTQVLTKLKEFFRADETQWVSIDFSDWSGRRQELFHQIRQAVIGHKLLNFDYYGQYGEMTNRTVEPIQLLFKDYTWYLRGYCRNKNAVRLFKIVRVKRLVLLEEDFQPDTVKYRETEVSAAAVNDNKDGWTKLVLLIKAEEAYRIYDRFEEEEIQVIENGDFLITMQCLMDDWVYGLIFSFGSAAEVVEPETARQEVIKRLRQMNGTYQI